MIRKLTVALTLGTLLTPCVAKSFIVNGYNVDSNQACFEYAGSVQCVDWEEEVVLWRSEHNIAGLLFHVDESFERLVQNVRVEGGYQVEVVGVQDGEVYSRHEVGFDGDVIPSPDMNHLFVVGRSQVAVIDRDDDSLEAIEFDHDLGNYRWVDVCECLEVQEWHMVESGSYTSNPEYSRTYRVYPDGTIDDLPSGSVMEYMNVRIWLVQNLVMANNSTIIIQNIESRNTKEYELTIPHRPWIGIEKDGVVRVSGWFSAAIDGQSGEVLRMNQAADNHELEAIGPGGDEASSPSGFILRRKAPYLDGEEFYVEDVATGRTVKTYPEFWN